MNNLELIVMVLIIPLGILVMLFPYHVRRLMEWWIGFWQYERPTEEWFTRKWTPNYIRAIGFVYLLFAAVGWLMYFKFGK